MSPDATTTPDVPVSTTSERSRSTAFFLAFLPVVLLGLLLAAIVRLGPQGLSGDREVPPIERVAIVRTDLSPGRIELSILNDGPDAVTIAQVAVDDAFWMFEITPGQTMWHLQRARISIPYPWVQGETHVVRLMTSTGVTFEKTIAVATDTPRPSVRMFGVFMLIGVYVGVVPVALGLMWYPVLVRMGRRGLQFLMALTIGLLAYLLVDAAQEGLEAAAAIPGSLQGTALFVFGALAAYLGLEALGGWLARRQRTGAESSESGWILALVIAIGIGLHNFGEGLAIGSAFALGELALGTLLIVGFTLHNTTEGLAIVAPLARRQSAARVSVWSLSQLGAIGGGPTILGAWIGAFVQSPVLAVLFFALGVGGIAQVTRQILSHSSGEGGVAAYFREPAVAAGLATGVALMYVTGAIVG